MRGAVQTAVPASARGGKAADALVGCGGVLIPATLVLCWASYLLLRTSDVVMVGLVLIYVMLPTAVAVAVFRAELFDVDRVMANGLVATGLGVVALSVLAAVAGIAGVMIGQNLLDSRPPSRRSCCSSWCLFTSG
ncbi:hypothetical protein NHF46_13635 [Arthrobacter alpinus]|nr:hypothetical protein [Arthrobacter alpinus]